MTTKTIVISGINMVEGGIFTILDNCLQKISKYAAKNNLNVIALVHDASKFNYPNIEYISFPKSKKNWLFRIYYEYFYFKKLSKKIKPDIWLSLHDVSPNVVAQKRFVYCHHPTVFYKASLKDWKFDYKIGIFSILYKYLFKLNIKKNNAIFVQQHWIKKEFEQLFNINNIIVSKPEFIEENIDFTVTLDNSKIHFFYPTLSKSFKNIEQIAEAILLVPINLRKKIKVHITIQKKDNIYAKNIVKKYSLEEINYIGKITRKEVFAYYKAMDCLIFPSKLETWGLPITEAKSYNKPILVADLPYAKETVGTYKKVSFFDINNPKELSELITKFVLNTIKFQENIDLNKSKESLENWNDMFDYIFKE